MRFWRRRSPGPFKIQDVLASQANLENQLALVSTQVSALAYVLTDMRRALLALEQKPLILCVHHDADGEIAIVDTHPERVN